MLERESCCVAMITWHYKGVPKILKLTEHILDASGINICDAYMGMGELHPTKGFRGSDSPPLPGAEGQTARKNRNRITHKTEFALPLLGLLAKTPSLRPRKYRYLPSPRLVHSPPPRGLTVPMYVMVPILLSKKVSHL